MENVKYELAKAYKLNSERMIAGKFESKQLYGNMTASDTEVLGEIIAQRKDLIAKFTKYFNVKGTRGYNGRSREEVAQYNLIKLARKL